MEGVRCGRQTAPPPKNPTAALPYVNSSLTVHREVGNIKYYFILSEKHLWENLCIYHIPEEVLLALKGE